MKLYDAGRAPNPRRVQIFLAEKGIEIEREQLDLNGLEHRSPEIAKKNPWMTIPFLELDDGTVISETAAICRYFEEFHPNPRLFGSSPLERAIIEMWHRRLEMGLFYRVAQSFRHLHPGAAVLEEKQIKPWGEVNKDKVQIELQRLNEHLTDNEYLAGEAFSVADIVGGVGYQFMKPAKIEVPKELEHVKRWADQVTKRPSFAW